MGEFIIGEAEILFLHFMMLSLPSHMDAAFLSSCLGVVERHSGMCNNITESERDEAR